MAYRQGHNLYVAECVDLNLMVKAKRMNKAIESLNDAIAGYLSVVCQGDTKGLIPRKSPLNRRLKYRWVGFKFFVFGLLHRNESSKRSECLFNHSDCHA